METRSEPAKPSWYWQVIIFYWWQVFLFIFTVNSLQENVVPLYRISASFDETFRYDSADLRKVNFDTSNLLLSLSGRNKVTTQGQPIACLSIPLAGCSKLTTPSEWHPLVYRITLPSGHNVEECPSLRSSNSWEQQGTCWNFFMGTAQHL